MLRVFWTSVKTIDKNYWFLRVKFCHRWSMKQLRFCQLDGNGREPNWRLTSQLSYWILIGEQEAN